MSTDLIPLADIERMAVTVAKSGMFGMKTPDQAMALMLLCQAENLHPMIAVRDYDIIQGRPAKKSEAVLRSFLAVGGKVEWHANTDELAEATFSHPQGGSVRISWDMPRAKRAGLTGKDNYSKFPRQMLAARCISEGCRRVWPASTAGVLIPEEAIMEAPERDVTAEGATIPEKPTVAAKLKAVAAKVDTDTGEIAPPAPLPTSDLLPRISACATVAEVEALRPEVAKLPKGSEERRLAVELAKAMIEELNAKPQDDAMEGIKAMQDDVL